MTPSRCAPSMNINVSLCAGAVPRSGSSLLSMRPSKSSPLGLVPTKALDGNVGPSGAEPKTLRVERVPKAPFTNPSPKRNHQKHNHQNQASSQHRQGPQAATAKGDTTAPNSAPHESTNSGAAFPFSGTLPRVSNHGPTAPLGPDETLLPQRTQAKNEGTNAAATSPAPASSPSSSSSALITAAAPDAASPALPKKCPMLTISSALCNDNFTDRRNRGRSPAAAHQQEKTDNDSKSASKKSARKNVNDGSCCGGGGKARYQERFAPLRPTDRGQIEELQRRRRENEQRSGGSRQQHQPPPSAPAVEPPSWAVPAPGEAKLEPVCESLGVQDPVDLTSRPCFRVGRSPGSDVQLLHATSSRRHALLFHHPNGSCYVVDCGSAHGTYVNGVRVPSASVGGGSSGASGASVVVPHRVKRGALVRFGGPGAPSFVLKSFSVGFESLVKDLPGVDAEESSDGEASSTEESMDELLSGFPSPSKPVETLDDINTEESHRGLRRVVSKEGEDGVPMDSPSASSPREAASPSAVVDPAQSEAALVQLNTRLNALGGTSHLPAMGRRLARRASAQLSRALRPQQPAAQKRPMIFGPEEQNRAKKARTTETVALPQVQTRAQTQPQERALSPKPVLVSPIAPAANKLLLSPDVAHAPPLPSLLSSLAPTPVPSLRDTLTLASSEAFMTIREGLHKNLLIPSGGDLNGGRGGDGTRSGRRPPLVRKSSAATLAASSRRRVRFSGDAPQMFYPPSVTPDYELSSDEGEDHSFALAPTPPTTPRALLAGF